MRLEGQMKGGFYPTPKSIVEKIASKFDAEKEHYRPKLFTVLDPCAGYGEALKILKEHHGTAVTHGIELDAGRRETLAANADIALAGDAFQSVIGQEQVSLLWLNPPYDDDSATGKDELGLNTGMIRKELAFLRRFEPSLMSGGILVYIIPVTRLDARILNFITARFDILEYSRFPDEEYRVFKQIVLIAKKRITKKEPNETIVNEFLIRNLDPVRQILELRCRDWRTTAHVIPASDHIHPFRLKQIPPKEAGRIVAGSSLWGQVLKKAPRSAGRTATPDEYGVPPIPPKGGQLALLVAAGVIRGSAGTNEKPHLLRGTVRRVMTTKTETTYNDEGKETGEVVTKTYRYMPAVYTMDQTGQTINLASGQSFVDEKLEEEKEAANAE